MIINITYGASASGLSAAFKATVNAAVQFLQTTFVDPITINIQLDSAEIQGEALPEGALAVSLPDIESYSYAQIHDALTGDVTSSNDVSSTLFLPASNPVASGTWYLTSANAKAIGLAASPPGGIDGYIGVANDVGFDFDPSNGVSGGAFDLFAVIVHEITHIMGRILGGGVIENETPSYAVLDLFKYKQDGTLALSETIPGYVSLDGASGYNELYDLNTDLTATTSDWAVSVGNDAFVAIANPGVVLTVSPNDIALMDAMGYNLASPPLGDLTASYLGFNGSVFSFNISNPFSFVGPSTMGLYASTDTAITTSDILIGTIAVGVIQPSQNATAQVTPAPLVSLTPGSYFVGAVANYDGAALERTTANNASTSTPVDIGNNNANSLDVGICDVVLAFDGDDTINVNKPQVIPSTAYIDGGVGFDTLVFGRNDFDPSIRFSGIEKVAFQPGSGSFQLACRDENVGASQTLVVDASALASNERVSLDGSAETDGAFNMSGGAGDDTLVGGAMMDTFFGGAGSDIINGAASLDTMAGGPGDDTYFAWSGYYVDVVIEAPGEGTDTIYLQGSQIVFYVMPDNVENLVATPGIGARVQGNDLNNVITGNASDNQIDGKIGADTMIGGQGDDTYFVDNPGDVIVEYPGEGSDGAFTRVSWTLSDGLETLVQLGADAIDGTGNSADNYFAGNDGNNTLRGLGGNDTFNGGAGTDTLVGGLGDDAYILGDSFDTIVENPGEGTDLVIAVFEYTLGPNLENVSLVNLGMHAVGNELDNTIRGNYFNSSVLEGRSGNDRLIGSVPNDTLLGGDGDDYLEGGLGADRLDGGSGTDTVSYEHSATGVNVHIDGLPCSGGEAEGDTLFFLEKVIGSAFDDTLAGNSGNNALDGALGYDRAIFSDARVSYTITRNGLTTTISGPDGIDTLTSIEQAQFSDQTINVDRRVGDANADGIADLLWQTSTGAAAIWLMDGLRVAYGDIVGPNPGPTWHIVGNGDYSGDGKADILWHTDTGIAAIWLMDGLRLLGGDIIGPNPGTSWNIVGSGDFDGDGKSDILWQTTAGVAAVWLMDGLRLLGGDIVGPNPGPAWHIKSAADFNGDGKADILWETDSHQVGIWLMDGLRLLGGDIVGPTVAADWHIKAAGDFDGDGKADILWENGAHQAAIWLMDGLRLLGGDIVGPTVPADWHIKGAEDLNGDGKSDIVWQAGNGQPAAWLMNGTQLLQGDLVGPNPGTSWHVISPTG